MDFPSCQSAVSGQDHVDPSKVAELSEKGQDHCRYAQTHALFASVLYDTLNSSIERCSLGPAPFPKGGWAEIFAVSKPPIQTSFIFIVDMKLLQFGTHRVVGINMLSPDSSSQAEPTFSWSGLRDYTDLSVKVCLREYHTSFPFSPLTQILR